MINPAASVKVIELRNYLLRPGAREPFIDYFERHFVESQNALGGMVLGAFRIEGEADRFFWLRGFSSMASRSRFLPEFYGGEIWKKFGPAANEMMLEWHRVHLLKPFGEIKVKDLTSEQRIAEIDFYSAAQNKIDELIETVRTAKRFSGATLWTSETAENDFPRLPVIQDENLLAAIKAYGHETESEAGKNDSRLPEAFGNLIKKHERLILSRAF